MIDKNNKRLKESNDIKKFIKLKFKEDIYIPDDIVYKEKIFSNREYEFDFLTLFENDNNYILLIFEIKNPLGDYLAKYKDNNSIYEEYKKFQNEKRLFNKTKQILLSNKEIIKIISEKIRLNKDESKRENIKNIISKAIYPNSSFDAFLSQTGSNFLKNKNWFNKESELKNINKILSKSELLIKRYDLYPNNIQTFVFYIEKTNINYYLMFDDDKFDYKIFKYSNSKFKKISEFNFFKQWNKKIVLYKNKWLNWFDEKKKLINNLRLNQSKRITEILKGNIDFLIDLSSRESQYYKIIEDIATNNNFYSFLKNEKNLMTFIDGNPGSGKTSILLSLAFIFKEKSIILSLSKTLLNVFENNNKLKSQYTFKSKTKDILDLIETNENIRFLLVDEAQRFSHWNLNKLLKIIENRREKIWVIFFGCKDHTLKSYFNSYNCFTDKNYPTEDLYNNWNNYKDMFNKYKNTYFFNIFELKENSFRVNCKNIKSIIESKEIINNDQKIKYIESYSEYEKIMNNTDINKFKLSCEEVSTFDVLGKEVDNAILTIPEMIWDENKWIIFKNQIRLFNKTGNSESILSNHLKVLLSRAKNITYIYVYNKANSNDTKYLSNYLKHNLNPNKEKG